MSAGPGAENSRRGGLQGTPAAICLVLFCVALASSILAFQQHQQLQRDALLGRRLELAAADNDRLRQALGEARRNAQDAQNIITRGRVERETSAIRELPFKRRVVYDVLTREGIRKVVEEKLSQQYTDQQMKDASTGLSAMGLLPPDFPLKQVYVNLLGEQIAAFYDQHQHKLFMFADASLENAQNRVILSHELTHALQDQNFGLLKMALEVKNDDDRAEAASALVEGDATLEMSLFMTRDASLKSITDTVSYSATQNMEEIRKAPRYLREMLVFPYLKGQKFCGVAYDRGGFPALSAVYEHPPTSTAQILHPEKYFNEPREEPIDIVFPETTFQGKKPLADNVLGEMGTRLLLQNFAPEEDAAQLERVAALWRGDRYLVYEEGHSFVWKTAWSDGGEKGMPALKSMAVSRFKLGAFTPVAGAAGAVEARAPGHFVRIAKGGANEVVFVHATTKESCDRLTEQFAPSPHG